MINSMSYVVHINNKISSTMWDKYDGKLKSGTICHWLYSSYCVVSCNNTTTTTTIDVSMTGGEASGTGTTSTVGQLRRSSNTGMKSEQ